MLLRNFKHLNLDFQIIENGTKLQVDSWFGERKTMAAIRTAISHVKNLITGVTKGYRYKMRFVYAHFPINASIGGQSSNIEIRNFLGEKRVCLMSIALKLRLPLSFTLFAGFLSLTSVRCPWFCSPMLQLHRDAAFLKMGRVPFRSPDSLVASVPGAQGGHA